jgi:hypothetical protein
VQALGRGCRELQKYAEGTIVCKDPYVEDESSYLSYLKTKDEENAKYLRFNSKIARSIHGYVTKILECPEDFNGARKSEKEKA